MKFLAAFLFLFLGVATATLVETHYEPTTLTNEIMTRQLYIYRLMYHIYEPNVIKEQVTLGQEYTIDTHLDQYNNATAVKHFLRRYKTGLLPKGRIFSVLHKSMRHDAESLFRVFYYAKTFDIFYKTACWVRENVNEELFIYALSVAVLHRPDCKYISLPPPYEVSPNYFFPTEVIEEAYKVKMQGHGGELETVEEDNHHKVYIKSNHSGWYINYNHEQKLSYFTEDIGWNSMYYYYHLDYPFWMNSEEFNLKKHGRGEVYYFLHKQILSRYYLERLSNGLGEIPTYKWDLEIPTGYTPSLRHPNGMELPTRPNFVDLVTEDNYELLHDVRDYEHRVHEAIDRGYILKPDGTRVSLRKPESIEQVVSIVESNGDIIDKTYYKYPMTQAKMLLGNSVHPSHKYMIAPSALELYKTSLRDPMFYQLLKRHHYYITEYKNLLTPYTIEELICPGVTIENVEVDKLITYMEQAEAELSNGVYKSVSEASRMVDDIHLIARHSRLTHKPFTITTNIQSEKTSEVVFRLFIGPKYDSTGNLIPLEENKDNFMQLDQFVYHLKSGKNTVSRNSKDFMWSIKDFVSTRETYYTIKTAVKNKSKVTVDPSRAHNGIPERLVLPKGNKGGMPFYIYVVVTPYKAPKYPVDYSDGLSYGNTRLDSQALGYPFDRPVVENHFNLHNIHLEDVVIFHKGELEVNTSHHE